MRLETTIYAKSGITTRAAQWGPIDKQLIFLRTQTGDYNLAWSHLIMAKDNHFFGHETEFSKIQLNVAVLPTESDIRELMDRPFNQRHDTPLPGIPIHGRQER
ncbi:hypothetical protein PGTUg99_032881 [Puccinia graminis f. sp. tritici]|uniref:Uncharacterized protein n=1 Tax=Puccinia graminis f. sp. tritici TaxID=56615 RepID=A0A5B0QS25_PUCGR|nr:hypothetical protein PGTUg99_032881 [Puccinia graminis f. sp. tritici]